MKHDGKINKCLLTFQGNITENYNYLCTCKSYGPVHNGFHAGKSITRGVGPWNSRYLWAP